MKTRSGLIYVKDIASSHRMSLRSSTSDNDLSELKSIQNNQKYRLIKEMAFNRMKTSKGIESERKRMTKGLAQLAQMKLIIKMKEQNERIRLKQMEDKLRNRNKVLVSKLKEVKKKETEINKIRKKLAKESMKLYEERKPLEWPTNAVKSSAKGKRGIGLKSSSNRKPVSKQLDLSDESNESGLNVDQIIELFEKEIQCSICKEYLINAVNLNCSHTFCYDCIQNWTNSQNNCSHVCPICREEIEFQTQSLVFNNLLNRLRPIFEPNIDEERQQRLLAKRPDISSGGRQQIRRNGIPINQLFMRFPRFIHAMTVGRNSIETASL